MSQATDFSRTPGGDFHCQPSVIVRLYSSLSPAGPPRSVAARRLMEMISADRYLKSKVEGASKEDSEKIDGNLLAKLLLGSQVRNLNNSIYLWKETD